MGLNSLSLLAASALVGAHASTARNGTLYGFAIKQMADDDHETAAVMVIDPVTGKSSFKPGFSFAASDQSSLDCFIGWDALSATYYATSGPEPHIITVDAASGNVTHDLLFPWRAYVLGFTYDPIAQLGVGVFSYGEKGIVLATVNTTSGDVVQVNTTFPFSRTLPCDMVVMPEQHWMIVLNGDSDRDDADDTWQVVDYAAGGSVVFTGPWSFAKWGRINSFTVLPPSAGALSSSGVICMAKVDDDIAPKLVWVSFAAPGADVTLLHDFAPMFPAANWTDITVTLNSITLAETVPGSAYIAYVLARDMGTSVPVLITVQLSVTSSAISVTSATMVQPDESGVAGDVYGLRWAPAQQQQA